MGLKPHGASVRCHRPADELPARDRNIGFAGTTLVCARNGYLRAAAALAHAGPESPRWSSKVAFFLKKSREWTKRQQAETSAQKRSREDDRAIEGEWDEYGQRWIASDTEEPRPGAT